MRSRREFDKSILNALPCHSLLVVARVAVLNMQYLWFSAWIRADQITGAATLKQQTLICLYYSNLTWNDRVHFQMFWWLIIFKSLVEYNITNNTGNFSFWTFNHWSKDLKVQYSMWKKRFLCKTLNQNWSSYKPLIK